MSDNWDSETYLAVITSFYSTVITVLLGAMGILGAFAFLVIRGAAHQQVEEEVLRYFATSDGRDKIQEAIRKNDRDGLEGLQAQISDIISVLEENEIEVPATLEVPNNAE